MSVFKIIQMVFGTKLYIFRFLCIHCDCIFTAPFLKIVNIFAYVGEADPII